MDRSGLIVGALLGAGSFAAASVAIGTLGDRPHAIVPRAAPTVATMPAKPQPAAMPASQPSPTPTASATPAPAPYVVKHVLPVKEPFRYGDFYWDESAAPAAGELVVTVDLAAQVISVFRDGYEIGTAVMIYGADEKPTPLGVFAISQKDADHVSNIYHAPMPYMLRLTNDGISIHGSDVKYGYATHGCVGVPLAFAKKLFAVTRLGTRVIVSNGETLAIGQAIKAA